MGNKTPTREAKATRQAIMITDEALIDHFQMIYLADLLEKEIGFCWTRCKTLARKVLDEINESGELFGK